ncbi:MAG: hypothetical protein M3349_00285, partial [Actinomycetota bacterium]|nr:hypothetical protein [Actinomycetota bacterium]
TTQIAGWVCCRELLEPNQLGLALFAGVELESDHRVAVERFGESTQGIGAAAVLAALDSGDH